MFHSALFLFQIIKSLIRLLRDEGIFVSIIYSRVAFWKESDVGWRTSSPSNDMHCAFHLRLMPITARQDAGGGGGENQVKTGLDLLRPLHCTALPV